MSKIGFLYKFPETDEPGFEFTDKHESGLNFRTKLRRLSILIVLLVGVSGIIFGSFFLMSSLGDKNDTLKNINTSISAGNILWSNIITVPKVLSDNSQSEDYVLNKSEFDKKPDTSSSEEWTSFENFLQFESNIDKPEDNSIIFHQPRSTINVNKDCEKSIFDKEFVKTLTKDQTNAVERLMEKVTSHLVETFCDASSENYLVGWLKCKDWNVEEAARALFHTIAWRKKEKIDDLQTEDFSYFDEEFPVFMDGKDFTGRMVTSMGTANGDIRKIMLAGKGDQMLRYFIRMLETGRRLSREGQFRGENITQSILIESLKGFNMKQHACDKCTAFMYQVFTVVEEHYPSALFKVFLINTPHEFEWILQLATAVLPSYIADKFEVFGTNKQEWQKAILEYVPVDQIRPQFGGTKTDDD